jgi:uncharacterized membrane protein
VRVRLQAQLALIAILAPGNTLAFAQAPAQAPPAKPPAKPAPGQPPPQETIPSPVSKHYPILIIAHGNEPAWSLRLGMKGPERLDRANYPPVVLEPAEVNRDVSGSSWTYNAKDSATGAAVAVRLSRDVCTDSLSDAKYTFRVEVDHAQIGLLKGCGFSSPDKFPEFRKKNQLDMPDDLDAKDKDKDKKTVLDPITKFASPVATGYLDTAGRVVVSRGVERKTAAAVGAQLALSHDGRKLLFTRPDSQGGPQSTLVLYEVDSGRARDLAVNARQGFWSPDDSKLAFLKYDGTNWQICTTSATEPEKATLLSAQYVTSLHGWASATTVLATDGQNAYWVSEDRPAQTMPLREIYGDTFQIMSSDTIRYCPINPDLLLVSAYYVKAPAGAPTDAKGLNQTFFLYELRSKRRTVLGPLDAYAGNAEWSRDALQVFFTKGVPGKVPLVTDRIFWDGTGDKRYSAGIALVVGK